MTTRRGWQATFRMLRTPQAATYRTHTARTRRYISTTRRGNDGSESTVSDLRRESVSQTKKAVPGKLNHARRLPRDPRERWRSSGSASSLARTGGAVILSGRSAQDVLRSRLRSRLSTRKRRRGARRFDVASPTVPPCVRVCCVPGGARNVKHA